MAKPERSTSEQYLAIDQGGHASRALIFDASGRVVGRGLREVSEHRIRPGWVEQDPEELVSSIRAAVRDAVGDVGPGARLVGGMATQRSSVVCWDRETGEALSPVLSWQDRRAHEWLDGLGDHAGRVHEKTGLFLSAHYGASKLRWCLDHLLPVREALEGGRLSCGPLASFLAFRLLESRPLATDPANAARTLLWSLHELDWDPELLELFGIPAEVLPACVPSRHDFGRFASDGAGFYVEVLTGDQSAALFAHGRPEESTAYLNLGTGAFIQRVASAKPVASAELLTGVVFQDGTDVTWVVEGTVNGAGSALAKLGCELGVDRVDEHLSEWIDRGEEPPLFLNGVSGLGSPYWVPDFESRFVGDGEPWEKIVAVAESIVFLVCVNLRHLRGCSPPFERILATGGLAWNDGLCRRLADLSGLPVDRPVEYEATARGTAYLVAGRPSRWPDPAPGLRFEPRSDSRLEERFRRWEQALLAAVDGQGKVGGVGDGGAGGENLP